MVEYGNEQLPKNRRKRVERLKKMIVTSILAVVLILISICVCLGICLHGVNSRLRQVEKETETMQQQLSGLQAEADKLREDNAASESTAENGEEPLQEEAVSESENSGQDVLTGDGIKRVYLTFDDGPSVNTAAILDILSEYQVKATFFVVGDTSEDGRALYRRIVEEGHSIGVHSYSHKYQEIYASEDAFFEDFYLLSDYLYDVTGIRPDICRLPGGSSNTVSSIDMAELVNRLNVQGVSCYDWNISGGDAEGHKLTSEEIAQNVLTGVDRFQTSIVLLHDGSDKTATVDALRIILDDLTSRDALEIMPITEETPMILHIMH